MKIASLALEPQDFTPHIDASTMPQRSATDTFAANAAHAAITSLGDAGNPDDAEDISLQKLQNVTEAMDAYMSSMGVSLKFNIDERTDTIQVEVRNPETDKLIRKIPADEMLDLAASIENMVGLFLDKTL